MQADKQIEIPERLRTVVVLGRLLETLEHSREAVSPDQYRVVVRRLAEALAGTEPDKVLDALLGIFPAMAEVYENLRYEQAGLCRSPLELSLNAELQASAALRHASRRTAA